MAIALETQPAQETGEVRIDAEKAHSAGWALYVTVVVSGAVLMGLEIAGAKLLAPGFGTSTYVWGSIISLFLGAMALGYYIGGSIADRQPSFPVLAGIVAGAGVWIATIPFYGPAVSVVVAQTNLPAWLGPLIASAALFFIPSVLMAMVSPYAVKLNATSLAGLGASTGWLYSISTFGSIVGTLLTTFWLVPTFSLALTLQGLGLMLMAVSLSCYIWFKKNAGGMDYADRTGAACVALIAVTLAMTCAVFPIEHPLADGQRLLYYTDSPYHEILVTEEVYFIEGNEGGWMRPVQTWDSKYNTIMRWLKFNENLESGIYPYHPEYSNAVTYTDLLHLPLLFLNGKKPERMLVVGGGGAIAPTQYHQWYGTEVEIAEIDEKVEHAARTYFQVPKTEKITFNIGDGRQSVRNKKDGTYDVIILDAYSSGGQIPFHLMTWEFLQEVKQKLKPGGVLISNLIASVKNSQDGGRPADLYYAQYRTLSASQKQALGTGDDKPLFQQVYVFPKVYENRPITATTADQYRNVILVAVNEDERRSGDKLFAEATRLTSGRTPQVKIENLPYHVRQMIEKDSIPIKLPSEQELSSVPIMRDNYAPVDTMYRPVKLDEQKRPAF